MVFAALLMAPGHPISAAPLASPEPVPVAATVLSTAACLAESRAVQTDSLFIAYVDPLYGDDQQALALNPTTSIPTTPPYPYPHRGKVFAQHTDPTQISGYLQHAPFAFKTLGAALSYVQQFGPDTLSLFHNLDTDVRMTSIVIHCLPGLYGPFGDQLEQIDTESGLPFNGESFPLRIPDNVSIQGTSALDTIFDARGTPTHIFEFVPNPMKAPLALESHTLSFIDGLTIRGAGGETAPQGAGIFVTTWGGPGNELTVDIRPKISNCFITGNVVGIAVSGALDVELERGAAGPVIFNNTIAWNQIGIWNGQLNATPSYGWTELCVWNNIFDATSPPASATGSAFEGMHSDDLLAFQPGNTWLCFNAWEWYTGSPTGWGKANLGGGTGASWPGTQPRTLPTVSTPLTPAAHGVTNIAGITGAGQSPQPPRGILYVSELLEARAGYAVSWHDFRLSPMVSANKTGVTALNHLVDQGTFSISGMGLFKNGLQVGELGLPSPPAGTAASYLGTDVDCEGYGNPRVAYHTGFPVPATLRPDLGADELDNLLIAGYLPSTRIFSRDIPTLITSVDHTEVLFVNLPQGAYSRPTYNISLSEGDVTVDMNWFLQVVTNPNPPFIGTPNNYTDGTPGALRLPYAVPPLAGERRPNFMRNLRCDFSPHPLIDLHPLWPELLDIKFLHPLPVLDKYGSNPWYRDSLNMSVELNTPDNEFLYYDPATAPENVQGHLNPPGTFFNDPSVWGNYLLWEYWPTGMLGPWNGGGMPNYTTDTWGVGDTVGGLATIDRIPEKLSWQGVRYNAQVFLGTQGNPPVPLMTNLQTFLGVNGPAGAGGRQSSTGPESRYVTPAAKLPTGDLSELVRKTPWWKTKKD